MRIAYLFIATTFLLASACKKETKEKITDQPDISVNDSNPCYGNNWELDDIFYGDFNNYNYLSRTAPLVYNNKIYVPDYEDQEVRIYDGTSWQTLRSHVPMYIFGNTVSFSIGNKGYLLCTTTKEFWQYNFVTNTWVQKTNFPGVRRYSPATFSIGSKGYIAGGGNEDDGILKDCWEYNPSSNTWVKKADLLSPISSAAGFSIGTKGYVVTGQIPGYTSTAGMFEYSPASNSWTAKALFPGEKRRSPIAFVISEKAYVGGGSSFPGGNQFNDYYRYNPASNSWVTVADMPVPGSRAEHGFTLNSTGYGVFYLGSGYGMLTYTPQYCTPGPSPGSNNVTVH